MLKLDAIIKDYGEGDNIVHALKGLDLRFRNNEFVAILGPSGCGKTTLLNIVGGLDRYTMGDLIINGKSTKFYNDRDWDDYRNKTIGFVFQSYNLIPHLNIEENVEMALSLAGVSREERKKRALAALSKVGLSDKVGKKPAELSGGQMQRVAIARSLVNNPAVILADEPTGALDTDTGLQVMDVLKEVAKDRLVIMVTHNPQLAETYATRIIKMIDGKIVGDSHPLSEEETASLEAIDSEKLAKAASFSKKEKRILERKSRMSLWTSFTLSFRNLLTKKSRSFITAFACSIGIIGMAVILSVSNGMQSYVNKTMADSTYANYLSVSANYIDYSQIAATMGGTSTSLPEYPTNTTGVTPYTPNTLKSTAQDLSADYVDYLEAKCQGKVVAIDYTYGVAINALTKKSDGSYLKSSSSAWDQILDNAQYIGTQYETLAAVDSSVSIPSKANEAALVVDSYNRLSTTALSALGIAYDATKLSEIPYSEILGKEFKVLLNNDYYVKSNASGSDVYSPIAEAKYAEAYASANAISVKIVSVLRPLASASNSWINSGLGYSAALTKTVLSADHTSEVAQAQYASKDIDVLTGQAFASSSSGFGSAISYQSRLASLGYSSTPSTITIYPTSFAYKDEIKVDLDAWNTLHEDHIVHYTDTGSYITSALNSLITIITYVLVAFSAVSLVISSIMIALIIYASVIERTKEIGVLRALGARKKDIARIFQSEAIILGALSGIIALLFAWIDNTLINGILAGVAGVSTIAALNFWICFWMLLLGIALPLIASLVPASIAAKKDPVVALRSE